MDPIARASTSGEAAACGTAVTVGVHDGSFGIEAASFCDGVMMLGIGAIVAPCGVARMTVEAGMLHLGGKVIDRWASDPLTRGPV